MGLLSFLKNKKTPFLSKLEVTEHLKKMMEERWPEGVFTIKNPDDESDIALQITVGEHKLESFPDNLYANYKNAPSELDLLCSEIIDAISQIFEQKDVEPILLPTVKNLDWINEVNTLQAQAKISSHVAAVPLVADLYTTFALDSGQQASFLHIEDIEKYSESGNIDEIYTKAVHNFIDVLAPKLSVERVNAGFFISVPDPTYNTSLALLDIPWKEHLDLIGEPIMALIARDVFIVADSASSEQVAELKNLAKNLFTEASYSISPELFQFKDGKLVLYSKTLN